MDRKSLLLTVALSLGLAALVLAQGGGAGGGASGGDVSWSDIEGRFVCSACGNCLPPGHLNRSTDAALKRSMTKFTTEPEPPYADPRGPVSWSSSRPVLNRSSTAESILRKSTRPSSTL